MAHTQRHRQGIDLLLRYDYGHRAGCRHIRRTHLSLLAEARWAAFFKALHEDWHYDADGDWNIGDEQHYRPQFWIRRPQGEFYLEVADHWDKKTHTPRLDFYPEAEEHAVFLAVGDPPEARQMRAEGWWDDRHERGVMKLTPADDWDDWFPMGYTPVLAALEAALAEQFPDAVPLGRQGRDGASGSPQKPRERRW